MAQVWWCSVDKHVPHDGNGVILLRWGTYLKAAEGDHAVHHLGHTEAVPKIMKGVVSVIVMNTQLQREGMKQSETGELFLYKNMITYASQPPWKHCISLQESYGAPYYFLLGQSDSTRPCDTLPSWGRVRDYCLSRICQQVKLIATSLSYQLAMGKHPSTAANASQSWDRTLCSHPEFVFQTMRWLNGDFEVCKELKVHPRSPLSLNANCSFEVFKAEM